MQHVIKLKTIVSIHFEKVSKLETLGLQVKIYQCSFYSNNKLCKKFSYFDTINSYEPIK